MASVNDAAVRRQGSAGRRGLRLLYLSPDVNFSTHQYLRQALARLPQVELTACGPGERGAGGFCCAPTEDIYRLLKRRGWLGRFDVALYVEAKGTFFPRGLTRLPFPVAGYLLDIDHKRLWAAAVAEQFDQLLVSQRYACGLLKRENQPPPEWIPFAADPAAYRKLSLAHRFDVGFVGQVTALHSRRGRLLDLLRQHVSVRATTGSPAVASEVYSSSRLVFNCTAFHEVTVRTFEAMACGACLLTDPSKDGSLETLFKLGRHLLTFDDETLVETVRDRLSRPNELGEIALNGYHEFLARHTFDHRAGQIVRCLERMRERGITRSPSRRRTLLLQLETEILSRRWCNRMWQRIPHPLWASLKAKVTLHGGGPIG